MSTLEHSVDIPAPVDEVWEVLSATDDYVGWNPFITRLDGRLAVGERLVVALEPVRLVRWKGRLGVRGIFDGEHELRLEPTPSGGTRFTQHETFSGVLIPLMRGVLEDTLRGFTAMNEALRDRILDRSQ